MDDEYELSSQFWRYRGFSSFDLRQEKELQLQQTNSPEIKPVNGATDVPRSHHNRPWGPGGNFAFRRAANFLTANGWHKYSYFIMDVFFYHGIRHYFMQCAILP